MAYYLEATGGDPTERAEIRFADDGFVDVYVGTQSTGQGHETAYVQLTVDRLGIDGEKIRIRQGDTDTIPVGGGTGGARSLYSEGQAILATTATVIEKGRKAASEVLEAATADIVFDAGRFSIAGTDRGIDIITLAATQRQKAKAGEDVTTLDAAEVAQIKAHTFPNGCHIAEVEVDPETGVVSVVRYSVTDDVGTRGQSDDRARPGAWRRGAGRWGRRCWSARPTMRHRASCCRAASWTTRCRAPTICPNIEVELIEVPCGTNPLGVKGAGEAGAVGSPPAVMNALIDALRGDGITKLDMPATPEVIWKALAAARKAA